MKKRLQWWVVPGIITASLAGFGALGTFIVKSADYIRLPEAMAAESKRNDSQDQRLDKLITLQEYQANQQMNQSAPRGLREWDDDRQISWCCPTSDRQQCFDANLWETCP